jgi:hypothetical protein
MQALALYGKDMKLCERFEVTKDMIWEVSSCHDILEQMSDNLSSQESVIEKNGGAFFVWRSLMSIEVLLLSKLINEEGPFSLQKLINIASSKVKGFDVAKYQSELEYLRSDYVRYKMNIVRDKFVAHQDLILEEVGIDIHKFCIIKNGTKSLFNRLSISLEFQCYEHQSEIVNEWSKLFTK